MPDTNLKDDAVVNRAINADDILFAADPDSTTDADAFASDTVTEFLANLVERAIDPHLTLDQVDEDTTVDPNTPRRDRIILHWTDKDGDDLTSALEVREFIEAIVEMTYDVKNIIALTFDEATATIAWSSPMEQVTRSRAPWCWTPCSGGTGATRPLPSRRIRWTK